MATAVAQFLHREQQRRGDQRQEVIDHAPGEQRTQQLLHRHARQREHHHRLEHAEAAGHVARDAGNQRDGIEPAKSM